MERHFNEMPENNFGSRHEKASATKTSLILGLKPSLSQNRTKPKISVPVCVPAKLKADFEKALKKMGFNRTDFFRGQMRWLVDYSKEEKA